METIWEEGKATPNARVLTVPMRNGNFFVPVPKNPSVSSYRTYEEWKLRDEDVAWHCGTSVLTVPMRNGNLFLL